MADTVDFSSSTVDELRNFLKQRGVTYCGYPKSKLVHLKAKNLKRLGIQGINNRRVQLLEPSEVQSWAELLRTPDIDLGDIFAYLMASGWSPDKLNRYKDSHGYRMLVDKHVACVKICSRNVHEMEEMVVYVKATVKRETSINATISVWAVLSGIMSVFTSGCKCPGDDGSCKHVIALLFSLQDWSQRHHDRHTEVGTDIVCNWDHARVSSNLKILKDITKHHSKDVKLSVTHKHLTPQDAVPLLNEEQVKEKIFSIVSGSCCQLTKGFETPIKVYPPTLKDLLKTNFGKLHT